METNKELKNVFRTIVREAVPELKRLNVMIRATVTKVDPAKDTVDFAPLNTGGLYLPVFPNYQDISKSGMSLVVGDTIRVGFYNNDYADPYVDAVI